MIKNKLHKGQILILLAVAQFMVVLDSTVVNVALPSISKALHFSPENLQWIVTGYTLTFGGFLLFGGRAADLYGRRRVFMAGIAAFTVASLLTGLSQSEGMLIAFRAIQGLSAAFMSPAALSIVVSTFKEGKERNKALGVWGGVAAGGAAAGLLIGGILTEWLNWRWNFFINVPVGIALLYFVPRIVPESKANLKHMHLDLPGAVLATSGLMLLVYGLVKAPEFGWTSSHSIQYIGGSIVLLGLFILNEARSKQPLMPLHIFKNRNLQGGNLVQLPITAAMFSMFFFLSLYIQTTLDFSPIKTGFAFFPVTIVIGITSAIISNVVTKIGFKPPMIVGPLFLAAGLMWFTKLPVDGSYLTDVLPGLMIMALGLGFSFVSVTIAATSGVSHDESGLASGILNTSQQIGGSLGLAILSGVYAATLKDNLVTTGGDVVASQVAGYHDAFKIGVGFALTASIFAMIFIKNKVVKSSEVHPAG